MSTIESEIENIEQNEDLFQSTQERRQVLVTGEARRRLEDRLEQRRLEKAIQEYDFDLD